MEGPSHMWAQIGHEREAVSKLWHSCIQLQVARSRSLSLHVSIPITIAKNKKEMYTEAGFSDDVKARHSTSVKHFHHFRVTGGPSCPAWSFISSLGQLTWSTRI